MLVLLPPHLRLIPTTESTTTTACSTMLVLLLVLVLLLLLLLPLIILINNTNNFRPSLTLSLLLPPLPPLPPLLLCSVLLPLLHSRRRRCTLRPPPLRPLLRCRQPIAPCQLNLLVTLRILRSPRLISNNNNKIIITTIIITLTRTPVPLPNSNNHSNFNNCPPIPLPTSESSLPVVDSPKSPTMPMCSLGIISSAPSWS